MFSIEIKKSEFKEIIKYNNNFAIKFKQDKNVLNKNVLSDYGEILIQLINLIK